MTPTGCRERNTRAPAPLPGTGRPAPGGDTLSGGAIQNCPSDPQTALQRDPGVLYVGHRVPTASGEVTASTGDGGEDRRPLALGAFRPPAPRRPLRRAPS